MQGFLHWLFPADRQIPGPTATSFALTHTVHPARARAVATANLNCKRMAGVYPEGPLSLRLGWVACCSGSGILSSLPPLKLLQVETDGAQQHPRYRAHDRNCFSILGAHQPRIFAEFDLGTDYRTSACVSIA